MVRRSLFFRLGVFAMRLVRFYRFAAVLVTGRCSSARLAGWAFCFLILASGCGPTHPPQRTTTSTSTTTVAIPDRPPLPQDYVVLATHLAAEARTSKVLPTPSVDAIAQTIRECHASCLALDSIQPTEPAINALRVHYRALHDEMLQHLTRLRSLPLPPDWGTQFITSFLGGFYTGYTGDPSGIAMVFSSGVDTVQKAEAIRQEVIACLELVDRRADLSRQLLAIARNYAAAPITSPGPFRVDIDEAWGGFGTLDWITLENNGPDLENVTIECTLHGQDGDEQTSVFFTPSWPSRNPRYLDCSPGIVAEGHPPYGRQTVNGIRSATITLWSPKYSTTLSYLYEGAERDGDIAANCRKLRIQGRYQPFQTGILYNTERGMILTHVGPSQLPASEVTVRFSDGSQNSDWSWKQKEWPTGESRTLSTPADSFAFDPKKIDVEFHFPRSSYVHRMSWNR